MSIDFNPGDDLIRDLGKLFDTIRFYPFPALEIAEVADDDGETYTRLRCPRCGNLVNEDDLYAVDFAERWNSAYEIDSDSFEEETITFDGDESGEFDSTVYYRHDDHAVSLPDGFREAWA